MPFSETGWLTLGMSLGSSSSSGINMMRSPFEVSIQNCMLAKLRVPSTLAGTRLVTVGTVNWGAAQVGKANNDNHVHHSASLIFSVMSLSRRLIQWCKRHCPDW